MTLEDKVIVLALMGTERNTKVIPDPAFEEFQDQEALFHHLLDQAIAQEAFRSRLRDEVPIYTKTDDDYFRLYVANPTELCFAHIFENGDVLAQLIPDDGQYPPIAVVCHVLSDSTVEDPDDEDFIVRQVSPAIPGFWMPKFLVPVPWDLDEEE